MKQRISLLPLFALLAVLPFVFSSCSSDDDEGGEPVRPQENIIQVLNATEGLSNIAEFIGQPSSENGLATRLANNEHTLFAPNDAAFANLYNTIGISGLGELQPGLISDILFYHIVPNTAIQSNQLDSTATAFNNSLITLSVQGDSVLLNPATQPSRTVIVSPDLNASNGVVHVINEVLLPPSVVAIAPLFGTLAGLTSTLFVPFQQVDGSLATINSVFDATGLLSSVLAGNSPHTVLAPINEAFNNFFLTPSLNIDAIANYHIIPGEVDFSTAGRTVATLGGEVLYVTILDGTVFLNGTPYVELENPASNGKLLASPSGVLAPPVPLEEAIDVASALTGESFSLFNAALEATELDLGTGKTIFVPTDQAFQDAGLVTTIDSAARIDPAVLADILQAHVFEGINFSVDIVVNEPIEIASLNGTPLTISVEEADNRAFVRVQDANEDSEDATVVFPDNLTTSGVVHVIDQLLLPN